METADNAVASSSEPVVGESQVTEPAADAGTTAPADAEATTETIPADTPANDASSPDVAQIPVPVTPSDDTGYSPAAVAEAGGTETEGKDAEGSGAAVAAAGDAQEDSWKNWDKDASWGASDNWDQKDSSWGGDNSWDEKNGSWDKKEGDWNTNDTSWNAVASGDKSNEAVAESTPAEPAAAADASDAAGTASAEPQVVAESTPAEPADEGNPVVAADAVGTPSADPQAVAESTPTEPADDANCVAAAAADVSDAAGTANAVPQESVEVADAAPMEPEATEKSALGIVGFSSAMGKEMLKCLQDGLEQPFPAESLRLFDSSGEEQRVQTAFGDVASESFSVKAAQQCEVVLLAETADFSKEFAEQIAGGPKVTRVIDSSSALHTSKDVPCVCSEMNGSMNSAAQIVACPDGATAVLAMTLWPLHQKLKLRSISVDAFDALSDGTTDGPDASEKQNVVTRQLRSILGLSDTAPLLYSQEPAIMPEWGGHSLIKLATESPIADISEVRELLQSARGVKLMETASDDSIDGNDVQVKKICVSGNNALRLWISGSQSVSSAARNAVLLAEAAMQAKQQTADATSDFNHMLLEQREVDMLQVAPVTSTGRGPTASTVTLSSPLEKISNMVGIGLEIERYTKKLVAASDSPEQCKRAFKYIRLALSIHQGCAPEPKKEDDAGDLAIVNIPESAYTYVLGRQGGSNLLNVSEDTTTLVFFIKDGKPPAPPRPAVPWIKVGSRVEAKKLGDIRNTGWRVGSVVELLKSNVVRVQLDTGASVTAELEVLRPHFEQGEKLEILDAGGGDWKHAVMGSCSDDGQISVTITDDAGETKEITTEFKNIRPLQVPATDVEEEEPAETLYRLAIFGDLPNRCEAQLRFIVAVSQKSTYFNECFNVEKPESIMDIDWRLPAGLDWGIELHELGQEILGLCIGKSGNMKKNIKNATGCVVEYFGATACIAGPSEARVLCKSMIETLRVAERGHVKSGSQEAEKFLESFSVPSELTRPVSGTKRENLTRIENEEGVLIFWLGDLSSREDEKKQKNGGGNWDNWEQAEDGSWKQKEESGAEKPVESADKQENGSGNWDNWEQTADDSWKQSGGDSWDGWEQAEDGTWKQKDDAGTKESAEEAVADNPQDAPADGGTWVAPVPPGLELEQAADVPADAASADAAPTDAAQADATTDDAAPADGAAPEETPGAADAAQEPGDAAAVDAVPDHTPVDAEPVADEEIGCKLLIYSLSTRSRLRARVRLQSFIEARRGYEATYSSNVEPSISEEEGAAIDVVEVAKAWDNSDEMNWASGKKGQTRINLQAASGCCIEYFGSQAYLVGTKAERARARDYLSWWMSLYDAGDAASLSIEASALQGRTDVTIMHVTQSDKCVLEGDSLRTIEQNTGTIIFFREVPPAELFATGKQAVLQRGSLQQLAEIVNVLPDNELQLRLTPLEESGRTVAAESAVDGNPWQDMTADAKWEDEDETANSSMTAVLNAATVPLLIFSHDAGTTGSSGRRLAEREIQKCLTDAAQAAKNQSADETWYEGNQEQDNADWNDDKAWATNHREQQARAEEQTQRGSDNSWQVYRKSTDDSSRKAGGGKWDTGGAADNGKNWGETDAGAGAWGAYDAKKRKEAPVGWNSGAVNRSKQDDQAGWNGGAGNKRDDTSGWDAGASKARAEKAPIGWDMPKGNDQRGKPYFEHDDRSASQEMSWKNWKGVASNDWDDAGKKGRNDSQNWDSNRGARQKW